MKIEERFTVPFSRGRVWRFLHNIETVILCLPGAELTETGADGRLAGRFSVRLGPITAAFSGNAEVTFDETAYRGEITGAGNDRRSGSRAKGSASFTVSEQEGGTRVDLVVDYALAGALAQFNRGGIVEELAARLTTEFADNLQTALATDARPPKPPPPDAGHALGGILWRRVQRWLRAVLGRY